MILLTVLFAVLSAVLILAQTRAEPLWRSRLRAGAIAALAVTAFSGYFARRESRAVRDLARVIEPVPEIERVLYIPTPEEVTAISTLIAAAPVGRTSRQRPEERRAVAQGAKELTARFWKVDTRLSTEEVMAFYRLKEHHRSWRITADSAPYLQLERSGEALLLVVQQEPTGTSVWYIHEPADR